MDALKVYREENQPFYSITADCGGHKKALIPEFSITGSSQRQNEETIVFNFYQFLKQLNKGRVERNFIDVISTESEDNEEVINEIGLTLQDVSQYLKGAENVPLGSIDRSIIFMHDALKGTRLKANNCALQLSIPVNERYHCEESATFESNFADDILDG